MNFEPPGNSRIGLDVMVMAPPGASCRVDTSRIVSVSMPVHQRAPTQENNSLTPPFTGKGSFAQSILGAGTPQVSSACPKDSTGVDMHTLSAGAHLACRPALHALRTAGGLLCMLCAQALT